MKWTWAGVLAAFGFTITGCQTAAVGAGGAASQPADVRTIVRHTDPAGAEKLLAAGQVVVLDIRTPKEYAADHLRGSKLLDFNAADFKERLAGLDRSQAYLLHCASGRRSTKALDTFKALGFREVIHLDGGINAWKAEGKPVVR